MGLAWLSLFFSWNVNMVVEAHKVLKRRRHKHRPFYDLQPESVEDKQSADKKPTVIDIFSYLGEKDDDDYNTVIKEIGMEGRRTSADTINRSKSCSDILATNIQTLDHSPRRRRMLGISELFLKGKADLDKGEEDEGKSLIQESNGTSEPAVFVGTDTVETEDSCAFDSDNNGIIFTVPTKETTEEEDEQPINGDGNRFTISKVIEEDLLINKDGEG